MLTRNESVYVVSFCVLIDLHIWYITSIPALYELYQLKEPAVKVYLCVRKISVMLNNKVYTVVAQNVLLYSTL